VAEVRIEPKDFGKTAAIQNGDVIEVELQENPTTGFRWQASSGSHLAPSGDQFVSSKDPAPGAAGTRILRFRAVSLGSGVVRLQLRREWESSPAQQTVEIPYEVR